MGNDGPYGNSGSKGGGRAAHNARQRTERKPIDESGGVLGEYSGTMMAYDKTNDDAKRPQLFGFISCPDLAGAYGDIFVNGHEKKGFEPGDDVKFTAFLTKDNKPQAKHLKKN